MAGLSLLFFWDTDKKLTGIVINVASTAQAEQGGNLISADFWHDIRKEIAARHSKDVLTFVVQLSCQASGYLPTARAVPRGGHSADEYLVGPDGGRVLVDESVNRINVLWP